MLLGRFLIKNNNNKERRSTAEANRYKNTNVYLQFKWFAIIFSPFLNVVFIVVFPLFVRFGSIFLQIGSYDYPKSNGDGWID